MTDRFKRVRLADCLAFIVDNRGRTPPLSPQGIELIEVNAIEGNQKHVNFEAVRKYVSNYTYNTWFRKGHPQPGDTLISTVGAIGRVAYVTERRGCIAQNVIAMRPKAEIIDAQYFFICFLRLLSKVDFKTSILEWRNRR